MQRIQGFCKKPKISRMKPVVLVYTLLIKVTQAFTEPTIHPKASQNGKEKCPRNLRGKKP